MNIKTITSVDGVNTVDFGSAASRFYWFKNIGTTTVYVSGNSDISAGGDGVAELPSGGSVCIETLGGKVYILGEGKAQIHNTGDKFCPFRNAPVSGDGGKTATVSNPNLLINPDFSINQRGKSGTIIPNKNADGEDIHTYFVDRWGIDSGTVVINTDGTLTLNGTISQILENAVGTNVTASVSAGTAVYDNTTQTFTITGNGDVISWAKLEYGNAATAFIPPDPATELMKCMRYYEVLMEKGVDRSIHANLLPGNICEVELLFKTAKRAVPSLVSNKLRFVVSSSTGYVMADLADIKQYTADHYGMSIITTDILLSELPSYLFGVAIDTTSTDALAVDAEIY